MRLRTHLDTRFLSARDAVELVRRDGLAPTLSGIARCIEEDFRRWPDFDKSARMASHSRDGVIELMPVADGQRYSFKYVNGHPRNTRFGLPTVMAFGVLADVATGAPVMVSELTLTTALRTAAMSAVAARRLARQGYGNVWWLAAGIDGWRRRHPLVAASPVRVPARPYRTHTDLPSRSTP